MAESAPKKDTASGGVAAKSLEAAVGKDDVELPPGWGFAVFFPLGWLAPTLVLT